MNNNSSLKTIKELFKLINKKLYSKFFLVQLLIVVSACLETASFFSILPFVSLIVSNDITGNQPWLYLYEISGADSTNVFIIMVGLIIIMSIAIATVLTVLRIWYTSLFANEVGFSVGDSLFAHYLKSGYEFHIINNSSYLSKQITVEAIRIKNMMKSLMQLNSDIFMATIIFLGLLYYETLTTIILVTIVSLLYISIHLKLSNILLSNGRLISKTLKERFKIVNNSLGGISEVLLTGSDDFFIAKMKKTGKSLARGTSINQAVALAPAKLMQGIILIILVSTIVYTSSRQGNISNLIVTLSVYIMAAYKIMPLFQSMYANISNIKGNSPALEVIEKDFTEEINFNFSSKTNQMDFTMSGDIVLKNISYKHPGQKAETLRDVNTVIKKGQKVGVVGESGSGKTTLIKLLCSLLRPSSGKIFVGDVELNSQTENIWRRNIGVILQENFLIDGSIAENIAFGKISSEIDHVSVNECIKKANLEDFVKNLAQGIDTHVGERGVQLSGGQRQRIGIARAFYHNSQYLIMDEATSALDNVTEGKIIEKIIYQNPELTVIMIAHRVQTLKESDIIIVMDKGEIAEVGTYAKLSETSKLFDSITNSDLE